MLYFILGLIIGTSLVLFFCSRTEPTCPECGGTEDMPLRTGKVQHWDGPVCKGKFHEKP